MSVSTLYKPSVDTSHLFDERRCTCHHERKEHSIDGDICWSDEPLGFCTCAGFVECTHEGAKAVSREGGDVRGVGVDVATYRCECGEEWSE